MKVQKIARILQMKTFFRIMKIKIKFLWRIELTNHNLIIQQFLLEIMIDKDF